MELFMAYGVPGPDELLDRAHAEVALRVAVSSSARDGRTG
jgi:hypothetical protein